MFTVVTMMLILGGWAGTQPRGRGGWDAVHAGDDRFVAAPAAGRWVRLVLSCLVLSCLVLSCLVLYDFSQLKVSPHQWGTAD